MKSTPDRPDGLNPDQLDVVKLYAINRIRATCRCEIYDWKRECRRCQECRKLREAFPATWTLAADIAARMGPRV